MCEDKGLQYFKYKLKRGDNIYLKANVTLKTNKETLSFWHEKISHMKIQVTNSMPGMLPIIFFKGWGGERLYICICLYMQKKVSRQMKKYTLIFIFYLRE